MGVWIEMMRKKLSSREWKSLPLWECGLKFHKLQHTALTYRHSPCGSVDWNISPIASFNSNIVTPLVGVWIEIQELQCRLSLRKVTPLVGVWIEMFYTGECEKMAGVTPLVGVWIEIVCSCSSCGIISSLPLWECGLKFITLYAKCEWFRHSPCGSVDWNSVTPKRSFSLLVTPLVGVWIEIEQSEWGR